MKKKSKREERIRKIQQLTGELVKFFEEIRKEKDATMSLFYSIITMLPGVEMTGSEFVEKDYHFKGTIRFYSDGDLLIRSNDAQRNDIITFAFRRKDYKVVINLGSFTGRQLYCGECFEVLNFIFKELRAAMLYLASGEEKKDKLETVLRIMGG